MAYKVEKGRIKIDIRLDNGVYRLSKFSGDGKTRLGQLLDELRRLGEETLTINDYTTEFYNENNKIPLDRKVYLFDRYDQYIGKFDNEIQKLGNTSIVLIDNKSKYSQDYIKLCVLGMLSESNIVVVGGNICE